MPSTACPTHCARPGEWNWDGQDQDWIFFDQRGGMLSAPSLDCGPSLPLNDAGPLSEAAAKGLIACGSRHAAAGVDLSSYNALEVARDVQDLRTALGLERFDLFGVSYGSRVAFSVLRAHAAGVRAVVLDSVWPPEATWAEGGPKPLADAAHLILAQCAATRACRTRFPHAATELAAFATRLLTGPVTVKERTYTADDLGGFLMDRLYDGDGARSLPRDAHAFSRGDYSALDAQIADRSQYLEAQHLAFLCKEEFPFERRDHVADGIGSDPDRSRLREGLPALLRRVRVLSGGRPGTGGESSRDERCADAVPVGAVRPGCPPPLAEAAARRFARSQFVLVPNTTHGVHRVSPCGRQMIRAFLADPTRPVDRACLSAKPDRFDFALK